MRISITEVEIVNDDESLTEISKQEKAEMFPEVEILMQKINEVIEMSPEEEDYEVSRSSKSRTKGRIPEQE